MSIFHIAWLLSYISIASFSATIITPALPDIQQQFHLLQGQVEWMVSAFLIGYVIGQLIYGPLANRFGRVTALRIGLIINLIGLFICLGGLYLDSYVLLIWGRLISALGAASGLACTFMLINEWLPEEQRRAAMAYTILSFTLGTGIAVLLGGIITQYSYWGYCFILLFVHGLLMLYGTRVFSETLREPQLLNIKSILRGYFGALSSGILVIYSLVVGLATAIGYCFSAAGPQISVDMFQLSPAQYGYWNSVNMIGMLGGGLLARALLQVRTANRVVGFGLIGTAVGLASLILLAYSGSSSVVWFFFSTLLMYLFSGLFFAGGSFIASNSITDKASGAAMMSFINMSTATLAVVIMGYLGFRPLFSFIFILSALWVLVVFVLMVNKGKACSRNSN